MSHKAVFLKNIPEICMFAILGDASLDAIIFTLVLLPINLFMIGFEMLHKYGFSQKYLCMPY